MSSMICLCCVFTHPYDTNSPKVLRHGVYFVHGNGSEHHIHKSQCTVANNDNHNTNTCMYDDFMATLNHLTLWHPAPIATNSPSLRVIFLSEKLNIILHNVRCTSLLVATKTNILNVYVRCVSIETVGWCLWHFEPLPVTRTPANVHT